MLSRYRRMLGAGCSLSSASPLPCFPLRCCGGRPTSHNAPDPCSWISVSSNCWEAVVVGEKKPFFVQLPGVSQAMEGQLWELGSWTSAAARRLTGVGLLAAGQAAWLPSRASVVLTVGLFAFLLLPAEVMVCCLLSSQKHLPLLFCSSSPWKPFVTNSLYYVPSVWNNVVSLSQIGHWLIYFL